MRKRCEEGFFQEVSVLRKGSGGPLRPRRRLFPRSGGEGSHRSPSLWLTVQGHECRTASGGLCSWVLSGVAP